MTLRDTYNKLDDFLARALHKAGLFELDASLQNKFHSASRGESFADRLGISNKAKLEQYNERHPDQPLPSPYRDASP